MRANLVPRAFEKLSARSKPDATRKSGRQNAVLALADIYDESKDFLNGARFDVFWGPREIHIKELIINTTEFKTGVAFRFHKGAFSRRSGNRFVPLRRTTRARRASPTSSPRHLVFRSDSSPCFSRRTSAGRKMNRSCV